MAFPATIERVGTLDIVSIGMSGFNYSKVAENAEAAKICATPVGRKYTLIDDLVNKEFDFCVPFGHLYDAAGNPQETRLDQIRTFGPQELVGGRKIVAGLVSIDFVGSNPRQKTITGIQKILHSLGNPLENRWGESPNYEDLNGESVWEELICTVEELPDGISVLRFNFFNEPVNRLDNMDIINSYNEFKNKALSSTGIS